jgi:xylulokinase
MAVDYAKEIGFTGQFLVEPKPENVKRYKEFYQVYRDVYPHTVAINHQLFDLRNGN